MTTNAGMNVEEEEPLYTISGNHSGSFSKKKLDIELQCNPVKSLLAYTQCPFYLTAEILHTHVHCVLIHNREEMVSPKQAVYQLMNG